MFQSTPQKRPSLSFVFEKSPKGALREIKMAMPLLCRKNITLWQSPFFFFTFHVQWSLGVQIEDPIFDTITLRLSLLVMASYKNQAS